MKFDKLTEFNDSGSRCFSSPLASLRHSFRVAGTPACRLPSPLVISNQYYPFIQWFLLLKTRASKQLFTTPKPARANSDKIHRYE